MTNGLRIKKAREEANLTLEDIAARIGVAMPTIYNWRYEMAF